LLFCSTVVSLVTVPFVHVYFAGWLGQNGQHGKSNPKPPKGNKKMSKTAESPTDLAYTKMVESYTGIAVNVTWAHMQKGINLSIPGCHWGSMYRNNDSYKGTVLKMIACTTMNDLIHASFEGIRVLFLARRDKGSVTDLLKYNTLQGRWFGSCKQSEQADDNSEGMMINRRVYVALRVGGGTRTSRGSKVEMCIVTRVSTTTSGPCVRWESRFRGRAWTT